MKTTLIYYVFGRAPSGRAIRYKSSLRCGLYATIPHAEYTPTINYK